MPEMPAAPEGYSWKYEIYGGGESFSLMLIKDRSLYSPWTLTIKELDTQYMTVNEVRALMIEAAQRLLSNRKTIMDVCRELGVGATFDE